MFIQGRPTTFFLLLLIFAYVFLSTLGDQSSPSARRPSRFKGMINRDRARYKWIAHHRAKARAGPVTKRRMGEEEVGPATGPQEEAGPAMGSQEETGPAMEAREEAEPPMVAQEETGPAMPAQEEEPDVPIEEREGPLKSTIEGSVKLPMYAAADFELGQYVVDVEVGNPVQKLRLVVDTGSDLTWVKCKNLPNGAFAKERGFEPSLSSTFQPITCDTTLCKEDFQGFRSLAVCPKPTAPCLYNISYGLDDESTTTYGMFTKETATLPTTTGKVATLPNFLLGCTESYSARVNMTEVDGILGLGIHPFSFSMHAVNKFGGTFSYCLVDHLSPTNHTSYLIFGENKEKAPIAEFTRYTVLGLNEGFSYYWVSVKGITVGDKMLNVPPLVWRGEEDGGTIVDSGTSATYWTEQAYRAIMDALVPAMEKHYPKLELESYNDGADFEYCFNSTAHPLDKSKVPRLEIHFNDGARFKPHVKSYIIDDSPDIKCIGFLWAPGGINIIGNILQQNYLWEFDLHHRTMGFYPSTCS